MLVVTGVYFLFSVFVAALALYNADSRAEKIIGDAFMLFCFLLSIAAHTVKQFIIITANKIRRQHV